MKKISFLFTLITLLAATPANAEHVELIEESNTRIIYVDSKTGKKGKIVRISCRFYSTCRVIYKDY